MRSRVADALILGLAAGVVGLVAFGVPFAVSSVAAYAVGMLRLCFWPLEALWMAVLYVYA